VDVFSAGEFARSVETVMQPDREGTIVATAPDRSLKRPRYPHVVEPIFFESPDEWRAWLEGNHDIASEVRIGIWKARTGKPTVTWAQAVREALCFGWIDGQARRIDDESHMQRFTPRKSTRWSAINVALVEELEAAGLMHEAGRRAFAARDQDEEPYSVSKRPDQLPPDLDARLRENAAAAAFWDASPPSYRKMAAFYVTSAKREETREKRLAILIEDSANGLRLKEMRRR
jgi:uncharacterized protein YdeI (YjbR/CyaY-like superfamily)